MISPEKTIFVAGAGGMVGSSVVRELRQRGVARLLTPSSDQLDLTDQAQVASFFCKHAPNIVVLAAAAVGGIAVHLRAPADMLVRNLLIQSNTIRAAAESGVEKLIFISSAAVYPLETDQPMAEERLLQGRLEPTIEAYAVAKIVGIKLCESYYRQDGRNFFALSPPNLYGPHDKFDPEIAHVVPALITRVHRAKIEDSPFLDIWGTGNARREFLYAGDVASAIVFAIEHVDADKIYEQGISQLNVGMGSDVTIRDLAQLVASVVGYKGELRFDHSKPEGAKQKLLDVTRIRDLGWRHNVELRDGLEKTYEWYSGTVAAEASALQN